MGVSLRHRLKKRRPICFPEMDARLLTIYREKRTTEEGPSDAGKCSPPPIVLRAPQQIDAAPSDPAHVFVPKTKGEKAAIRESLTDTFAQTSSERSLVKNFLLAKSFELAGEIICTLQDNRSGDFVADLIEKHFNVRSPIAIESVTGREQTDSYLQLVSHIHLGLPVSLDMLATHFEMTPRNMMMNICRMIVSSTETIVNNLDAQTQRDLRPKPQGKNDPREALYKAVARVQGVYSSMKRSP